MAMQRMTRGRATAGEGGAVPDATSGSAHGPLLLILFCLSTMGLAVASGALDGLWEKWFGGAKEAPVAASSHELDTDEARAPASVTAQDTGEHGGDAPVSASLAPEAEPGAFEHNQNAIDALEGGDWDLAVELLELAVELEPEVDVYAGNLAEAHLRRAKQRVLDDQHALAVEDYEAALALIEDEERAEQVRSKLGQAKAMAAHEADFLRESTPHFTFRYDGTREEIVAGIEELKVLLEATYQEYGDLFGRRPVEEGEARIAVVLYRQEGFNAVTGLGDWAGGVFDGTIRVPANDLRSARRVSQLRDVLRHEVAHAFTQSIGGTSVPSWLNEGIAQWLENPNGRDMAVRLAKGRLAASGQELFPLTDLRGTLAKWTDRVKIARAYDQALSFTDFLIRQYGTDLAFEMVGAAKAGGSDGAATLFRDKILIDLSVVLDDFKLELQR